MLQMYLKNDVFPPVTQNDVLPPGKVRSDVYRQGVRSGLLPVAIK